MTDDILQRCEDEPIHVPGSVQPHGVLLALDPKTFNVLQVSANVDAFLALTPAEVLGQPLGTLLGAEERDVLLPMLATAGETSGDAFAIVVKGVGCHAQVHRSAGAVILEIERDVSGAANTDLGLRRALAQLQHTNSVSEQRIIAVESIRALTGFDRVMFYWFDDEGHGDVLAEALGAGVDSYRGLRFPASDIPRQAREMYLRNWSRLIPDANYTPVPLLPALRPDTGAPLDMTFASLRSVSPVHLEYLRNMGVAASMSVSLVRSESLWGLIACHHRSPHRVSFAARAACEVIGRIVAMQTAAQEEIDNRRARERLQGVEVMLAEWMGAAGADVMATFVERGEALLKLADASGVAVCTSTSFDTVGATPTPAQVAGVLGFLDVAAVDGVFHTDFLSAQYPAAAAYSDVASGVLAMTLPGATPSRVLWFRPEVVQTVRWAGDPAKAVEGEPATRLHPRHSFQAWKQVLRGKARPWSRVTLDAVGNLRRRALELDLEKQIVRAERAVLHRDEMVAVLSHDLKNPLQVMGLSVMVLEPMVADLTLGSQTLARIRRSVSVMQGLIHNLLDLAKIEAGRFEVRPESATADALIADAFLTLLPIADAKKVKLTWSGDGKAQVDADRERMFQVLSNLVGNAIKFTPAEGAVTLTVSRAGAWVRFVVSDTGPGIAAAELAHIFDRYWQSRRGGSAGSGLGLYIVKGLVEAHGGRVWAESDPGAGATFYFTLPATAGAAG